MRTQYRRKLIDSIENAIGDIVNELIDKYYGDKVESEYDYERILFTIANITRHEVFNSNADLEDVIRYLERLKSNKAVARLVISYLISRALDESD